MTVDELIEELKRTGRPFALLVEDPPSDSAANRGVRIAIHAPDTAGDLIRAVDHLSQALGSTGAVITHRGRVLPD